MQNQLNSQYIQPQVCGQNYPAPSVGAVNIQIFNPTANPIQQPMQGFYQAVPCGMYPCNYNNMTFQPPMMQPPQIAPSAPQMMNQNIAPTDAMALAKQADGIAAQGDGAQKPGEQKAQSQGPKVELTDDYVKTLENYLNSQDKKIRLMGAKELFERFKEDETRKDDPALMALLNKTLQDPADTVKFVALTALDTGYANGNDETAQILNNIQSSTSNYGEDASLAAQILLKMSGRQSNQVAQQNANNTNLQMQNNQEAKQKMPNPSEGVLMTQDSPKVAQSSMNNQVTGNVQ